MNFQHKELAESRWAEMTLAEQMLNIGSEISRAERWKKKGNMEQCTNAVYRALELVYLTIEAQKGKHSLKEFCRLKEVIPDYFLYDNQFNTDGKALQKYFDVFAYCRQREVSEK